MTTVATTTNNYQTLPRRVAGQVSRRGRDYLRYLRRYQSYQKNEPEGFPSFFWTAEEDRQLLELRDQSKLDWEEIADRLMGQRSASACCSRYNRTLFNKQLEKMASKCRNNSGEQLPAVAEEREEEIYQGVPASLPPETSPHSPHPQTPMVISPTSSSLPGSREPLQDYHWLSTLSMDKEGDDQSFYQAQPPPLEPLEPSVADTCSESPDKEYSKLYLPQHNSQRTRLLSMRLSGLQRDVLSLYRQCLRAARTKPEVIMPPRPKPAQLHQANLYKRQHALTSRLLLGKSEMNKNVRIDKRDFAAIEFLLRKGHRQLEVYSAPGITDIH
ncbi:heat repeat protein [Apiospora kogelbergensis]|uniref:heat repeat protein n=1 Tax=Apiospora kogelbergensis TaxID=1337665 RepID=UPI0031312422